MPQPASHALSGVRRTVPPFGLNDLVRTASRKIQKIGEDMSARFWATPEVLVSTLEKVVSENPEYVYPFGLFDSKEKDNLPEGVCLYVHTDSETGRSTPGCVIGHVFHRLGVPLEVLERYEGERARTVALQLFGWDSADPSAGLAYLSEIQAYQDSGESWGNALKKASNRKPKTEETL